MTSTDYTQEARRIIELIKTEFTMSSGALFLEKDSQGQPFLHHIFPDLGDVAPFFVYFGEVDFIEQQVQLYVATVKRGFLVSEFPSLGIRGLVKSYEYTDLLLGLLTFWQARPNDFSKNVLEGAIGAVHKAFLPGPHQRSFYYPPFFLGLPIIDTRDATLIECFLELWKATGDEGHLKTAQAIYKRLIDLPFYKKHGLFADYEPTNRFFAYILRNNRKTKSATICKNTSNALFAFLELYKAQHSKDVLHELKRSISALLKKAYGQGGGITERYFPKIETSGAYLTASFPTIDFLCDLADAVPQEKEWALAEAKKLADFWIEQQGSTGLFALRPGTSADFFDSETDMTIALFKLFEKTGSSIYEVAAEKCLNGILRYHGVSNYALVVDIDSGTVRDATQRTKFICLFLKLLILKIEYAKGKRIYTDLSLFELLKDR